MLNYSALSGWLMSMKSSPIIFLLSCLLEGYLGPMCIFFIVSQAEVFVVFIRNSRLPCCSQQLASFWPTYSPFYVFSTGTVCYLFVCLLLVE